MIDMQDNLMPAERRYGLDVTVVVRRALKDAYARGEKAERERVKKNDRSSAKWLFAKLVDPIIKDRLTPREDQLLRFRFLEGATLEETGKKFGVTRERVRQVEARILAKIAELPKYIYEEGRASMLNELKGAQTDAHVLKILENKVKEQYTPIEVLHLSPRTLNALINGNLGSVEQLCSCTVDQIAVLRGIGVHAIEEIIDALAKSGRILKQVEEMQRNELGKYGFSLGTEQKLLSADIRSIDEITPLSLEELSAKIGGQNALEVQKKIFDVEKWHLRNPNPPNPR